MEKGKNLTHFPHRRPKAGFQIDASISVSDWPMLLVRPSYWLTVTTGSIYLKSRVIVG